MASPQLHINSCSGLFLRTVVMRARCTAYFCNIKIIQIIVTSTWAWHIVLTLAMFPAMMHGTAMYSEIMSSCARHSCLQTPCVYHKVMYHPKHELLQQALMLMHWQRHVSSAQGLASGRGPVGMPALCPVTQTPAPHASWSCSRHATVADLLCLSSVVSCKR